MHFATYFDYFGVHLKLIERGAPFSFIRMLMALYSGLQCDDDDDDDDSFCLTSLLISVMMSDSVLSYGMVL